jgi:hypothetical protein
MSYPILRVPTIYNTLPIVVLWLIVAEVVVPMVACGLARPIVSSVDLLWCAYGGVPTTWEWTLWNEKHQISIFIEKI